MATKDCYDFVRTALGKTEKQASDEKIAGIIDRVDREASIAKDTTAAGYAAAAKRISDAEVLAANVKKANAYRNFTIRFARRNALADKARVLGKNGTADLNLAMQSEIHSINTPVEGGKFSASGVARDLSNRWLNGLNTELQDAKLYSTVRSGQLEAKWTDELNELSKGLNAVPGKTKSKEALSIANIIYRWQNVARSELNKRGAWIGDYQGYVTRTSHDPGKIWGKTGSDADRQRWISDTRPLLDQDKTFAGLDTEQEKVKYLTDVWHDLVTGVHETQAGLASMKDPAFTGPGNLAGKRSGSKTLHFRNDTAAPWREYNAKYGSYGPLETIVRSIDRSGRDAALMDRWGTNPRAEFTADLQWLREKFHDTDPAAVRNFNPIDLQNRFDLLDGTANRPVNSTFAKVMTMARSMMIPAKLGNVAFAHLSSVSTVAAELNRAGIDPASAHMEAIYSSIRGKSNPEVNTILRQLYAENLGVSHGLTERMQPDDNLPGKMAKLNNIFIKMTGLTWMLNTRKTGVHFREAEHFGSLIGSKFDTLPDRERTQLTQFGITNNEWEMLRNAPDHAKADMLTFLTPKAADNIPAGQITQHLQLQGKLAADASERTVNRAVDAYRQNLGLRVQGMYAEGADRATVTPGIRERNFWYGGTQRGTIAGEIRRSASQFKMWPTAAISQQLGADVYGGGNKLGNLGRVAMLVSGATLAGIARGAIVDMLNGKNPRPLNDPRTWAEGAMRGGGLGLMGDFLFGNYNETGGSDIFKEAAGPVIGGIGGDVVQAYNIFKDILLAPDAHTRAIAERQFGPQMVKIANGYIPFSNLFYTKLAFDMAVTWQLQEAVNPGYLKRHEAKVKQLTGQSFWISPSKFVNQGTIAPSQ